MSHEPLGSVAAERDLSEIEKRTRKGIDLISDVEDISWEAWSKEYDRIATTLSLDRDRDREATRLLHAAMEPRRRESKLALLDVSLLLRSRSALVFGCGPSLDEQVETILPELSGLTAAKIAADGAASALLEHDLVPEIIVTDLDGSIPDIARCSESGTKILLHAHGDNASEVLKWLPRLRNVIPITQTEPTSTVRNFGGFTDGDKCLHLAAAMGASRLFLAGMDFGPVPGRRSNPDGRSFNRQRKAAKLAIGRRLTRRLLQDTGLRACSLPPVPFGEVHEIHPGELRRFLGGGDD